MCLTKITKTIKKPTNKIASAIGCFYYNETDLLFPFNWYIFGTKVPIGRWIKAIQGQLYADNGKAYIAGFHKYKVGQLARIKKEFPNTVQIPVKLRKIKYHGKQRGFSVLVAQEMFISENWRQQIV